MYSTWTQTPKYSSPTTTASSQTPPTILSRLDKRSSGELACNPYKMAEKLSGEASRGSITQWGTAHALVRLHGDICRDAMKTTGVVNRVK